ncbi:unnamed protein product [Didymodactylos carnosus]|uniref:glycogenin glucosyltransferase n=1 Tax=Didymodactylos carnosus TaxID=1234261 RepID=A0A813Y2E5_9BILA|nr:unnamed protein product [Didymodactylos carnosus]CAF0932117.1 unnamed protein product [Didymodactylos carnosus]CAF3666120.1 unnamed protein product [Didymodactylos carnosus]CAF3708522.1 unnamed protein product [Didymodactylos carnosus]
MNSDYACHDTISCELRANLKTVSEQREERLSNQQQYTNYARQVFFSALYTENYVLGALILGYSIRKYHPNHLMYMMYLDDKIKNNTLMALKEVGWLVLPVARIEPPLKGTHKRFIDQFTKLTLWSFTQYDSIIYLDSDTVVMNDISHLHHLVSNPFRTGFEFAAATDNWFGTYIYKFNAGVIVLHPSKLVYNELMRVYNIPDNYNPIMAEQEFLNQYFRLRYLELPTIYNMNMAVYSSYKNLWYKLRPDFKVVHYTIFKPFLGKYQRGYDGPYELYKEIWQDFTSHVDINRIKTKWNLRW